MEPHLEQAGGGARLGRYRLVRELGRGGQATVHEAVAEPDGARVVVTRLLLTEPGALDRLRREVAARAVQRPGLLRALDVGLADDGSTYVVFELVERFADGQALSAALEEAGRSLAGGRQGSSGRHTVARLGTGSRLGRFVLGERLGDGGMGEVWRARDLEADRDVAVKVLRDASRGPVTPGPPADPASEGRRRRFLREQQAAARVRHHGVVAVHDAGETDGVSWLAMDLVEGEPLDARLRRGPLEVDEALRLGAACARAVQALHEAGVLHRDIKPANILLDREGNPRLTDFGVAALEGADALTRTGQTIGTPLYMAPEQLSGHDVDARADVYALGAVLWEGLAGRAPWSAQTLLELAAVKSTLPERPSSARRGLSSTASGSSERPAAAPGGRRSSAVGSARLSVLADAVVLRALSPDREHRPPSAGALADALEQALAGRGDASVRRAPRALVVGLLVVLLVGALLAVLAQRGSPPPPVDLAALRRRVEAQLARAPRLATCPPELAASLAEAVAGVASGATGEEPAALRTWLGLLTLARGDVAGAAALASAGGPTDAPAHLALRGGVSAHGGEPVAALRDLEAAARAGLRPAELERWRARALARRGVERGEATTLLSRAASLRASPGAEDAAAGALLEVACQVGLGKRAEAEAGLARLAAPPDELRWDVAVLTASGLLQDQGAPAARDALARAARPPRPGLPREVDLAERVVERVRRLAARGRTLSNDETIELVADLELARQLAPDQALPTALVQELMGCARISVVGGHSLGIVPLLLTLGDTCPADAVVQAEVAEGLYALRFTDGAFLVPSEAALEQRYAVAGLRAARVARSMARVSAELLRLSALVNLDRLDEAARAVVDSSAALDAAVAERDFGAEGFRGPFLMLRARLSARRGDAESALRFLDEAATLAVLPELVSFTRLAVLREGGRDAQLLQEALAYAASGSAGDDTQVAVALIEVTWKVLAGAGRWPELARFLGARMDAPSRPDSAPLTRLRLIHALLQAGDREAALRRAEPIATWDDDFLARLRAGDPKVEARLRAAVGQ